MYKVFKIQFGKCAPLEDKKKRDGDIEQSVYLTGDMILFRVIDLLCHLFPPFFIFCGAQEAASVIDEPGGVHFSPLHTTG